MRTANKAAFFALTKDNFERIFPSADTTVADALLNLHAVMSEDDRMVAYLG